jgi:hypothetical protein
MATRLTIVVDRIEEQTAVLKLTDGRQLLLSLSDLPAQTKEGDVLTLTIETADEEKQRQEKTAKELLNEILSSN